MLKTVQTFGINIFKRFPKPLNLKFKDIDYVLFVCILMFKVILFEKLIKISFLKNGTFEYFKTGFYELIFKGDISYLQQGIYAVSFGTILLLSFWTLFLSRSSRRVSLFVLDIVLTFIIVSDLVYYRYYNDLISIPVLLQVFQVKSISGSIKNLFGILDLLFIVDFIILIPVIVYLRRKNKSSEAKEKINIGRIISVLLVFAIGAGIASSAVNFKTKSWGRGFLEVNWWNISVYNATGVLGFHVYDAYRCISQNILKDNKACQEETDASEQWFLSHQQKIAQSTPYYGKAKNKNVVVIQAEALQNFVINQKVNDKEITPNLNKLIKESIYLKNFYHQTAQGTTSDAEVLANCSLYPLSAGSVYIRYTGNEYDSLPGILKENGYQTAAFHANDPSFWNRYRVYPKMGFEHFFSKNNFKIDEEIGMGLSDESFFRQSIEKIKTMEKPFYAFLITLTSHHPFGVPEEYKELDLGDKEGTILGDYIHSVHYMDNAIGEMVKMMKTEGLWDETVFVIYGDHDSKLSDNGELSSLLGRQLSSFDLEQIKSRVPMIIHMPKGKYCGVYSQPAGQIDFAPSVLHLLGINLESVYMMGNNIFLKEDKLVIFRNGSFTDGKSFFIPSSDQIFENGTCYDIGSGQKTNIEKCREQYQKVLLQLQISDNVIVGNLIKKFRQ